MQCRQLTALRAENGWLAAGSRMVQQQALRDFANAMVAFLRPDEVGSQTVLAQSWAR
jgi:hypothetical protein